MNFKTLDFRTQVDMNSCQKTDTKMRRSRRELCLSQSSDYMQNLVLKVKTAMRQAKSVQKDRKGIQVYKENQDQESRLQSRDILKRNSENRLEQLKCEMKKNLIEYRRSRERLQEQQKQITPIKDSSEIRKVSAFAQSVISFSHKIDKLITVQKRIKQPLLEQTDLNERAFKKQEENSNSCYNSKSSVQKFQSKLDRENIENYKQSTKNSFAKLKENKNQKGMNQGKLLLQTRVLEQKTRNAMPSFIKRTYLEMSSSDGSKDEIQGKKFEQVQNKTKESFQNENINMPLAVDL